ncbi:hypothetical protein [Sulfobacillus thermosulfidooxidans]|uniref:hypothetical protein n=1 Tax=Sulfobacillus thermosulfidooxidans TaxID=28034 RepID=UPI0006B4F696|nr:hypothetical protein [Sulfobacillus thermosulfidooxidans]
MAQASQPGPSRPIKPAGKLPYWVEPAFTIVALGGFVIYSLWEVLFHNTGTYHNYVSPFFSPDVAGWFGFHLLTALYVVWIPFVFRFSCYYYRKEYYRAFTCHPMGCAVSEPKSHQNRPYKGEWKINNLHRYAWYLAVIVLIFLWKDVVQAFIFPNGFGVGLGSIILLINAILLTGYTFSCHAFRNLIGGRKDCFSCTAHGKKTLRYNLWHRVSEANAFHGAWAWASLFSVWIADLYIRLLIMGVIHDVRLF